MNRFDVHESTQIDGDLSVDTHQKDVVISGVGNSVFIDQGSKVARLKIEIFGNGNKLVIGKNSHLRGHVLIKGNGVTVDIGDNTTFTGVYLLGTDGGNISIGRWCMFSRQIEVRATDAHSLIDATTGNRINKPSSICIGNHVWIGLGVLINKGVNIADDNIVGAGSFVNSSFSDTQCVIAGRPAKIVRTGVTWHRSERNHFTPQDMDYWR